ncbi:MAG: maleylpyruvate isomerase family mycothiol-dependent enzyme [Acidimicrobiales bacterium]
MTDGDALVADHRRLFGEYRSLCRELSDTEWSVRSLCPDWSVRQVVAHAVGIEQVLLGWTPNLDSPPPFDAMGDLVAASASMSSGDFGAEVDRILSTREAELDRLTAADLTTPSITPVGPGTYGRFLSIRVFDLWVHLRDVRIPLDRPGEDGAHDAETALDEVVRSIGYIVGKRIGLDDGMTIRFDLTGPVCRRIAVAVVDGRAREVGAETVSAPDVVLSTDSTTFLLLACGRVDPGSRIDSGAISWSGDDEWGERAARSLRFTR